MNPRTTSKYQLTRRMALLGGAGLATAWLTGCDLSTDPANSDENQSSNRSQNGKEAPQLAERVKAGELPPVEERLPASPLVVEPTEGIGVYGGTWNTALLGASDVAWVRNTIGYDSLVRWSPDWTEVIPNVAESFSVENGGREFVFILREGMKWSDGEPFTADDVVFAFEDLLTNPELLPAGIDPIFCDPNGEPATLQKEDERTVRFLFAEPKGLFLEELAAPNAAAEGPDVVKYPKHYLQQFHPKYNDNVAELAAQEGLSSWVELMQRKRDTWDNPDIPVIFGWQVTTPIGSGTRVLAQRNPYYWKTDANGSQLPYLDEVDYTIVEDAEVMLLQATHGDYDLLARTVNTSSNRPVLASGREDGNYDFFEMTLAGMNEMVIMLNLNHKNEQLRNLFQNKDFRIGLSHAINREELIAAVHQKQGEARQPAPGRDSPYYDEEFAQQYIEFDVDLANEHLDSAGLTERDSDGFRLLPGSSERLSFTVEIAVPAPIDTWMPSMELIKGNWAEVGVDIRLNGQDRSIWTDLVLANNHDACVWGGAGGMRNEISAGYLYLPFYSLGSRWAVQWATWYESGGASGEEPPAHVKQQLDLYEQALKTVDEDERREIYGQVLEIAKEQFYVIGTIALSKGYGVVSNDFHNVPESMPSSNSYGTPGPTRPEQYYIAEA